MHVLRILLLVMTAGVLAFILYQAITRQIPRDAFWTVIAIACGFNLNLIYLWFSTPGGPPVAIEDKPPVVMEEKAPPVATEDKSAEEDSHDRQSYLRHRSSGRFRNHLFHAIRNCRAVRRKLERSGPDHAGPLRKHAVRPRNKWGTTLLGQWILRLRLPGAVGWPCLPLRVCAGERSGWPAQRLCRRTPPAVSGQRDLGR